MNNKGFTLIELLAVIAILSIISAVAIPSISSSIERTRDKQDLGREKSLITYTELYLSNHKAIRKKFLDGNCYVRASDVISYFNVNDFGDYMSKKIVYDITNVKYDVVSSTSYSLCS